MATELDTPFAITPAYDILLRGSEEMPLGLYHLHLATAEQLCRLHYSMNSVKAVKAKLRKLVDHGFVQIDELPTKRLRSPYHYLLDTKGVAYLKAIGLDVHEAFRGSKETHTSSLFVTHALELNDIVISAALLKRSNPNYWLESFIHERELKHRPYKASWQGGRFSLIPDVFLIFRMIVPDGRQRRIPIVIEHDRGSEEQQYFRRRIRAYLIMLRNEGYKELFGVGSITVAFTTSAGVERLKKMREWTAKELEAAGETQFRSHFYFTLLERPIDPYQVWVNTTWLPLFDNKPASLLGV